MVCISPIRAYDRPASQDALKFLSLAPQPVNRRIPVPMKAFSRTVKPLVRKPLVSGSLRSMPEAEAFYGVPPPAEREKAAAAAGSSPAAAKSFL